MTDFEIASIKRQWDAGVPIKQIVRTMPYPQKTALQHIWEMQRDGVLPKRERKRGCDLVVATYQSGMHNPYEIAETYGYKYSTVETWLKNAKLGRVRCDNGKNWKRTECSEKTEEIIKCLESGMGMSEIAKEFGVSRQWVYIIKKRSEDYDEYSRNRKRNKKG